MISHIQEQNLFVFNKTYTNITDSFLILLVQCGDAGVEER